jgi:hypothetical protein
MFQKNVVYELKTYNLCSIMSFENRAFCDTMWKNILQPGRSQMTIQYGACALHAE